MAGGWRGGTGGSACGGIGGGLGAELEPSHRARSLVLWQPGFRVGRRQRQAGKPDRQVAGEDSAGQRERPGLRCCHGGASCLEPMLEERSGRRWAAAGGHPGGCLLLNRRLRLATSPLAGLPRCSSLVPGSRRCSSDAVGGLRCLPRRAATLTDARTAIHRAPPAAHWQHAPPPESESLGVWSQGARIGPTRSRSANPGWRLRCASGWRGAVRACSSCSSRVASVGDPCHAVAPAAQGLRALVLCSTAACQRVPKCAATAGWGLKVQPLHDACLAVPTGEACSAAYHAAWR